MQPFRFIDTHQHVFWQGRDDRGLIDDMHAHGIEIAWLLSWEGSRVSETCLSHQNSNKISSDMNKNS